MCACGHACMCLHTHTHTAHTELNFSPVVKTVQLCILRRSWETLFLLTYSHTHMHMVCVCTYVHIHGSYIMLSLVGHNHSKCAHTRTLPSSTDTTARTSTLYTISDTDLSYRQELATKGDSSVKRENIAGLLFWKNKGFNVGFEGVQRGVLSERKGKRD